MSQEDYPGDGILIVHEVLEVDNKTQWHRFTNACRVDLESLRISHELEDYPETELVIPIDEERGTALVSRSSQHVAIVLDTDDGLVTAIEGRVTAEGGMDVYRDAGEGSLVQVGPDDEGVQTVAGLLQGIIQVTQYES